MHALIAALSALLISPGPALDAVSSARAPASADAGALVVNMLRFRSSSGQALIAVYNSQDGFPTKPGKAYRAARASIRGGVSQYTFENLPPGEYAVSIAHDENGNGRVDTNWLGIPTEGVGASNNAKGRMGPPRYKDARFSLAAGERRTQTIHVTYL